MKTEGKFNLSKSLSYLLVLVFSASFLACEAPPSQLIKTEAFVREYAASHKLEDSSKQEEFKDAYTKSKVLFFVDDGETIEYVEPMRTCSNYSYVWCRPTPPEEIRSAMLIREYNFRDEGMYNDKTKASICDISVVLIDMTIPAVIAQKTFIGHAPTGVYRQHNTNHVTPGRCYDTDPLSVANEFLAELPRK